MEYKLGLLAKDIHNSVLPRTYDFFGKSLGVEVDFQIYNVLPEDLEKTVSYLRESKDGFTVTMPYKIKIMEYCDELDESAKKCCILFLLMRSYAFLRAVTHTHSP